MPQNASTKGILLPILTLAGLLLSIYFLATWLPSENLKLGQGYLEELEEGWQILSPGSDGQAVSLPLQLPAAPHEAVVVRYRFSKAYPDGMNLRLRASMQDLRVYLDDALLFSAQLPASGRLSAPPASVWHFVPLPDQLAGKSLTLEISSPTGNFAGLVNEVTIGTGDALLWDLLNQNRVNLLVVLFLLCFGLLAILANVILRQLPDARLFYLGLFALSVAVWQFSEARLMQLISGNRFILGSISYLVLAISPIPLLLYLRVAVIPRYKKLFAGLAAGFASCFVLILLLQLGGLVFFIESALLTNALLLGVVTLILVLLLYDMIKHKNRLARGFLQASSALLVTIVIETVLFFSGKYETISLYSRVGIVIFFLILAASSVRSINSMLQQEEETRLLSRLAFVDALSGAANRLAFERDMEKRNTTQTAFMLLMMDINNLKGINDQHGHQSGDQAVKLCYAAINAALGDQGVCYRIGGDEFACISDQTDPAFGTDLADRVKQELAVRNADLPFLLDIAIGHAVYPAGKSDTLNDFINLVDHLMYQDKMHMKKNRQPQQATDS